MAIDRVYEHCIPIWRDVASGYGTTSFPVSTSSLSTTPLIAGLQRFNYNVFMLKKPASSVSGARLHKVRCLYTADLNPARPTWFTGAHCSVGGRRCLSRYCVQSSKNPVNVKRFLMHSPHTKTAVNRFQNLTYNPGTNRLKCVRVGDVIQEDKGYCVHRTPVGNRRSPKPPLALAQARAGIGAQ